MSLVISRVLAVWLAAVTVPFTVAAVVAGTGFLDGGNASARHVQSIAVSTRPVVRVTVFAGSLTVKTGPAGRVTLIEEDTVRGVLRSTVDDALRQLHTSLTDTPEGAAVTVPQESATAEALALAGPFSQHRDLTLEVPPDSSLGVSSGPAIVTLDGLHGPIQVAGSTGVIRLRHVSIDGSSRLRLARGAISGSVDMAGGSLDAALADGFIQLDVADAGQTHLQASTANGQLILPESYGIALTKLGSADSADGTIRGAGGGGSLTLGLTTGVISLR